MKISIITACHNCAPFIRQCMDSVRSQGYEDYEHVIIDDSSKDKSHRYLRAAAEKDQHIRLFRSEKHLHCGGSYNFLSKHVTGDIVCVLDADDVLAKNAMRKIHRLYEANPDVGYIWTQFWYCDVNLNKIRKGFSCHPGDRSLLEHGGHCFSHWRTFRRILLEKCEVFKDGLKSAVDKWMGYALEEVAVGGFIDSTMYKYRVRPGGLSYMGRKNWRRMKQKIAAKRESHGIRPFPIKILEDLGD